MLPTYPAILRGEHLEWGPNGAPDIPPATPVAVHVTVLTPLASPQKSGKAMAEALAKFAAAGGPSGFGDPVEWQRETRADRPLPGRDE